MSDPHSTSRQREAQLPTFSFVVPTCGRPGKLLLTLEHIASVRYPSSRYEVVVIDDGGESALEGSNLRSALSSGSQLIVRSQRRGGAAAARNHGARIAGGDLLAFLDDDMLIDPDHLRGHLAARAEQGDGAVAGIWDFAPWVAAQLAETPFGRFRLQLEQQFALASRGEQIGGGCFAAESLSAANLVLRRELFWEVGGFDGGFPDAGPEDQDFSLRARRHGVKLILDTRIRCLHNDDHLSLRAFCAREERGARAMVRLASKHPDAYAEEFVRRNGPARPGEGAVAVAKKALKSMLASEAVLSGLHQAAARLECLRCPQTLRNAIYRVLFGVHIQRGVRRVLTEQHR